MRLLWILTFTLALVIAFAFQNVSANKKGSGNKGMIHHEDDEGHPHHPDGKMSGAPSSLKNRHRDHSGSSGHSSSSDHNRKHKSKKHRKNKHHKHRDGKKHHSPGKNQQHHHHQH